MTTLRMGRNTPCPCGSGRKYKVCCLRRDSTDGAIRASPLAQPRPVFGDGADTRRTQPQLARSISDERPVLRIPIHYTYPEPFGEAECVYCFPVGQLFILGNGNVIRAERLQPSMQFRMQEGGLATVTAVEPRSSGDRLAASRTSTGGIRAGFSVQSSTRASCSSM